MKTPVDKSPKPLRQAAAHETPQQQDSSDAELQFVDNRSETASLQQLQEVTDSSPRTQGLAQLKALMNSSPRSAAMQNLQAMADNCPRQVAQRQRHNRVQGAPVGLQAESSDAVNSEPVQRVENEELLQGKFSAESPVQLAHPSEAKPNNTGLPDNLRAGVESLSSLSLDNVKVHYNSSKPAQLNAHAYAQGTDIHVAPGQEQHLPHEAWHVVQQAQGRVKPTLQMKDGVGVNDDQGLEAEADLMGGKAVAGVVQARLELGGSIESGPIGFAKSESPSTVSNNTAIVQRKLGLELEVAVPLDKMGPLSADDNKILKGEKTDVDRLKELFDSADAGYGKFGKFGRIALHADHSSRVLPDERKAPHRVMGRSILEMVFDPAIETQDELDETMKDVYSFVNGIQGGTGGLSKRRKLQSGVYIGPIDGDSAPEKLNWDASIHVNVGVDPRRLHSMLSWYSDSEYKPTKEVKQIPMDYARDVAEQVVKTFSEASGVTNKDAQYWNGLRGLTMILVMYLLSGADKTYLKSSVKNFATLLSKTRFKDLITYSMTPKEKDWLKDCWEEYKAVLIGLTRPKEDENSPLVLRTNKKGALKDDSWKIGHLFQNTAPILLGEDKEIAADDVGPVRSDQDKVTGGGRRKGMVLEFRSLPGHYKPNKWAGIAQDFLDKANEENSAKDYKEIPKAKKVPKEKEKEKDVIPDVGEVQNLQLDLSDLPEVVPIKKEDIVITQSGEFWMVDQEVLWKGDIWKVIKKVGIKQYTLSFIKKA